MSRADLATKACTVARALEIVGDEWTLMLLREMFLGGRRQGLRADRDPPRDMPGLRQADAGARRACPAVARVRAGTQRRRETNMKTRVTELFGIEHPIIQGGMHFVGSSIQGKSLSWA